MWSWETTILAHAKSVSVWHKKCLLSILLLYSYTRKYIERSRSWAILIWSCCDTRIFQICKPCTFEPIIYTRKYVKRHKMDQNKPCDNCWNTNSSTLLITPWISYGHPVRIKRVGSLFEFQFSTMLTLIWISRTVAGSKNWMLSKESLRVFSHSVLITLDQKQQLEVALYQF